MRYNMGGHHQRLGRAQLGLARTPGSASFLAPAERAALHHRQDAEKRRSRMASPTQGRWYGALYLGHRAGG